MLAEFQRLYPTGCLTSELVQIYNGKYIIRANVEIEGMMRASGMAASECLEEAEDRARQRAIMVLPIITDIEGVSTGSVIHPQQAENLPHKTRASIPSTQNSQTDNVNPQDLTTPKLELKATGEETESKSNNTNQKQRQKTSQSQAVKTEQIPPTANLSLETELIKQSEPTKTEQIPLPADITPEPETIPELIKEPEPVKMEQIPATANLPPEEVVDQQPPILEPETINPNPIPISETNNFGVPGAEIPPTNITPAVTEPMLPIIPDTEAPPPAPSQSIVEPSLPFDQPSYDPGSNVTPFTPRNPVPESANTTKSETKTTSKRGRKKSEPVDLSGIIAETDVEMQRLGWTPEQGREYLIQTYKKRGRTLLDENELIDFLNYLKSQPTPSDSYAIDPLAGF